MTDPEWHDVYPVIHAMAGVAVVAVGVGVILFGVPALFNLHDDFADFAAILMTISTIAGTYLASRAIWRSYLKKG